MIEELLASGEVKSCCAAVYEHPAVRWMLGGELHPGGPSTTKRALELLGVGPEDRLLDVASGAGTSALLAVTARGCEAVGVELGERAVADASAAAEAQGLGERASFLAADAEQLPLPDESFDAVLCECSLCLFPDKAAAMAEMHRVLRPGGRTAIGDVVAERDMLPPDLLGAMATVACVGGALPRDGYEGLLADAGFTVVAHEPRDEDAAALTARVRDRLRGARLLGVDGLAGPLGGLERAIALSEMALEAIADGALGYAIFVGER